MRLARPVSHRSELLTYIVPRPVVAPDPAPVVQAPTPVPQPQVRRAALVVHPGTQLVQTLPDGQRILATWRGRLPAVDEKFLRPEEWPRGL